MPLPSSRRTSRSTTSRSSRTSSSRACSTELPRPTTTKSSIVARAATSPFVTIGWSSTIARRIVMPARPRGRSCRAWSRRSRAPRRSPRPAGASRRARGACAWRRRGGSGVEPRAVVADLQLDPIRRDGCPEAHLAPTRVTDRVADRLAGDPVHRELDLGRRASIRAEARVVDDVGGDGQRGGGRLLGEEVECRRAARGRRGPGAAAPWRRCGGGRRTPAGSRFRPPSRAGSPAADDRRELLKRHVVQLPGEPRALRLGCLGRRLLRTSARRMSSIGRPSGAARKRRTRNSPTHYGSRDHWGTARGPVPIARVATASAATESRSNSLGRTKRTGWPVMAGRTPRSRTSARVAHKAQRSDERPRRRRRRPRPRGGGRPSRPQAPTRAPMTTACTRTPPGSRSPNEAVGTSAAPAMTIVERSRRPRAAAGTSRNEGRRRRRAAPTDGGSGGRRPRGARRDARRCPAGARR